MKWRLKRKAEDEVGRIGVAIDTLDDMEQIFKDIPLDQVNTNFTINATAFIMMAMYIVTAEKQGVARNKVSLTTQNDILKEYVARGTYIFPPGPSIRLIGELVEGFDVTFEGSDTKHKRVALITFIKLPLSKF
jgi:methylmalonyl-CoA mutase N-terminal domain/subunit